MMGISHDGIVRKNESLVGAGRPHQESRCTVTDRCQGRAGIGGTGAEECHEEHS